jgi:GT2 family glycosyltransferase
MNWAVILTCYNRKEKTLKCLESLFEAYNKCEHEISITIYLTDDGCTDGTASAVLMKFSNRKIKIINGTGQLFWAGGMRMAWAQSLGNDHDYYLLINDDTIFTLNVFNELISTDYYCLRLYGIRGIYVGTTVDFNNEKVITYGGSRILSRWSLITSRVFPNTTSPQLCDFGNANVMLVPNEVVEKIGIFKDIYMHSGADYDYTYRAKKKNIPVMITPNSCGFCENDHPINMQIFLKMTISQRYKFTFSPTGFGVKDYIKLNYLYFPYRLPFCIFKVWIRVLVPRLYLFFFDAEVK